MSLYVFTIIYINRIGAYPVSYGGATAFPSITPFPTQDELDQSIDKRSDKYVAARSYEQAKE